MNEDDPGTSEGVRLSDLVSVRTPLDNQTYDYYGLVPPSYKVLYEYALSEFIKYRPFVEIHQNFTAFGTLLVEQVSAVFVEIKKVDDDKF